MIASSWREQRNALMSSFTSYQIQKRQVTAEEMGYVGQDS